MVEAITGGTDVQGKAMPAFRRKTKRDRTRLLDRKSAKACFNALNRPPVKTRKVMENL